MFTLGPRSRESRRLCSSHCVQAGSWPVHRGAPLPRRMTGQWGFGDLAYISMEAVYARDSAHLRPRWR